MCLAALWLQPDHVCRAKGNTAHCICPAAHAHLVCLATCRLLRFPKPQLLVYTVLMVPVMYGASKLVADAAQPGSTAGSADASAGIVCIVLLPLPVFAYWFYVLWSWYADPPTSTYKRSKSSIMRAYQHQQTAGELSAGAAGGQNQQGSQLDSHQQHRASATLALLGNPDDSPTLIIRNRKSGEEEFDHMCDRSTRTTSDSDEDRHAASGAGGTTAGGLARAKSERQASDPGRNPARPSRWRSLVSAEGATELAAPAGAVSAGGSRAIAGLGSGSGGVLGSKSKVLRAGSISQAEIEELELQGRRPCHVVSCAAVRSNCCYVSDQ